MLITKGFYSSEFGSWARGKAGEETGAGLHQFRGLAFGFVTMVAVAAASSARSLGRWLDSPRSGSWGRWRLESWTNQPLHLAAAAFWFIELQRLTSQGEVCRNTFPVSALFGYNPL